MTRQYRIVDTASARYALSIRVPTQFIVETEVLDRGRAECAGRELTRLSQECGCDLGARFLMISIFVCVVAALFLWKALWSRPFVSLAAASLACFLSAGIGKTIGIIQAKRELRARLFSLCGQLESQEGIRYGLHR